MIGQTLQDRYTLTARLGKGAMGTVYRAADTQTGETVAVKVLAGELQFEPDMLERFRREGEALRQLRHPNIVGFVDAFQHDEHYVIVMEYVPGGSLHELIKQGPLPIDRARQIALDLCDALIRAHRLNIIHRDIKPENVLIAEDGTPRLTDFGVARLAEGSRLTGTGTHIGTPYYMSPEAWEGNPLDAQADIWSLGVVLYEMLAGEVPFGGETLVAVMNKVLTALPPELKTKRPEVPKGMADNVERMLMRDKAGRYQTVRQVAADLEVPASVTVSKVSATAVKSPNLRLTPWMLAWLTILGIIVIAGLIAIATGYSASRVAPSTVSAETTISATSFISPDIAATPPLMASVTAQSTRSFVPTRTPSRTAIPSPTPYSPADALDNTSVILDDRFDTIDYRNWMVTGGAQVFDGIASAIGFGTWETPKQITRNATIGENQGALVLFRFGADASFNISIERGDTYGQPTFRRFGLGYNPDNGKPYWVVVEGSNDQSFGFPEFGEPNAWYYLLLKVGQQGDLQAYVWEPDRLIVLATLELKRGNEWDDLSWRFGVKVHSGTVEVDEYQELDFRQPSITSASLPSATQALAIPSTAAGTPPPNTAPALANADSMAGNWTGTVYGETDPSFSTRIDLFIETGCTVGKVCATGSLPQLSCSVDLALLQIIGDTFVFVQQNVRGSSWCVSGAYDYVQLRSDGTLSIAFRYTSPSGEKAATNGILRRP